MAVQEDIAFDPGVRAVDIHEVVAGPGKHVVVDLEDGLIQVALAAREVQGVAVPLGAAKEAVPHDAAAARLDAAGAFDHFERRRGGGEVAMADEERAAVERDVPVLRRVKSGVIEV